MIILLIPSGSRKSSNALPKRGSGAGGPGMVLQWLMNAKRLFVKTQIAMSVKNAAIQTVKVDGIHRATFIRCSLIIFQSCMVSKSAVIQSIWNQESQHVVTESRNWLPDLTSKLMFIRMTSTFCMQKKDFCSYILGAKQHFYSNNLSDFTFWGVKQDFCSSILVSKQDFV